MNDHNNNFSSIQQEYLKGFFAGAMQRPDGFVGQNQQGQFTHDPQEAVEETVYGTPIDDLCKEEQIKHQKNGLDVWDTIVENCDQNVFPEPPDLFRYKFYGLFHVKPAQDSFMLRCRIPGCQLHSYQIRQLAHIAETYGGGYLDITTRGNLQIREIMPEGTIPTLLDLHEVGLTSKGSGADNIRNVTATPTSGYDPQEYIDVLPLAKSMHHCILNNRDLYGLPRKFNISFDSGGAISVCADTNDIAFYACKVENQAGVPDGVYFRLQLCGITGHKQFASDTGLLITPRECVAVAAGMVRVFIEHGDRTNRKKARLKYLIDDWGIEKFLEKTQEKLAFPLRRLPLDQCIPRKSPDQKGHLGSHPQKQPDLCYVGVLTPVGRVLPDQFRKIADLADRYGKGEIRLTVWQNLIVPHIHKDQVAAFTEEIKKIGFATEAHPLQTGLVACTGNTGCKFAAANTKGQSVLLGKYLAERIEMDQPINIHLTGCPHSCAQHYVGDIGLQAVPCKWNGEKVEGYHIVFGGGVDDKQHIAQEVFQAIPFELIPELLENCLRQYQKNRNGKESFSEFTRRKEPQELRRLFEIDALKALAA